MLVPALYAMVRQHIYDIMPHLRGGLWAIHATVMGGDGLRGVGGWPGGGVSYLYVTLDRQLCFGSIPVVQCGPCPVRHCVHITHSMTQCLCTRCFGWMSVQRGPCPWRTADLCAPFLRSLRVLPSLNLPELATHASLVPHLVPVSWFFVVVFFSFFFLGGDTEGLDL